MSPYFTKTNCAKTQFVLKNPVQRDIGPCFGWAPAFTGRGSRTMAEDGRGRQGALRSRPYLDRRSVQNDPPDLLDLFVGDRDTTLGPVEIAVIRSGPLGTFMQAVDHDVPAG